VGIDNYNYSLGQNLWSIPGSAAIDFELGKANAIKEDTK
jgi:hypothetical protein